LQVEYLDGANKYACEKCGRYVRARRGLAVAVAPNVLVLTLKRYTTGVFGKLNKTVSLHIDTPH
jgi:ubiquitin carboxyl-terminal hydrolase 36/42